MHTLKRLLYCFVLLILLCSLHGKAQGQPAPQVVAMHLLNFDNDEKLAALELELPKYKEKGINLIFLEVDYNFNFKTHPELKGSNFITAPGARSFANKCKALGIKVVPEFQSLGHQSWAANTWSLLTVYPELDLTPGAFPGNKDIYCREWDPTNPKVNEIIFPMIDEIVEAFQAEGIHIGMDEVFLLGAKESPNTFGKDPGELYAKVVNEFHAHFVKEKKLTMYMWGDRLIDANKYDYGKWEASDYGTAKALDLIPKDIIICDWHYGYRKDYPSIPMFTDRGFKVLPCSYTDEVAAKSLIKYSYGLKHPGMIGHCFTSWSSVSNDSLLIYPAFAQGIAVINKGLFWDVQIIEKNIQEGKVMVELSCTNPNAVIYYSTNGSVPTTASNKYEHPFAATHTGNITALAFANNKPIGETSTQLFDINLATGKNISIVPAPAEKYKTRLGAQTLVNGLFGGKSFADGQWVGIDGKDVEITIDLSKQESVSSITFNTINDPESWILSPKQFKITFSNDNQSFKAPTNNRMAVLSDGLSNAHGWSVANPVNARYVRISIPVQLLPEGHPGAGSPAWMFLDEIVVK